MKNKSLRAIGVTALLLTIAILAYTMTAATIGSRSTQSPTTPQSSTNQTSTQSEPAKVDPKLFPTQLAGMKLVDAQDGPDAVQSVSQLHGTNIQVQTAYVVTYQGNNAQMTIWYSETKNDKDAIDLFKAMDSKMPTTQAFQNYKTVKIDGKDYKFVTGMGQEHYYWQSGNRVIWVAIGSSDTLGVFKQVAPLYN